MKSFKPISFSSSKSGKFAPKIFQQNLLLKALQYTSDLDDLKKVANFHSKAEVLRTLDKLAIRRDYHDALAKNGMGPDQIVQGMKEIALSAPKDDTRLKAYQTILKSIGLDKYEASENDGKDWEDLLLKINDKERLAIADGTLETKSTVGKLYEVIIPEIPESVRIQREEDSDMEKSIYD